MQAGTCVYHACVCLFVLFLFTAPFSRGGGAAYVFSLAAYLRVRVGWGGARNEAGADAGTYIHSPFTAIQLSNKVDTTI